jgi:hypothetical protein
MRELIYSFFPVFTALFMMVYLYRVYKTKKSITWDIKKGDNCYSCKEFIEEQPYRWDNSTGTFDTSVNFKMCTSCNRDEKLDDVIKPSILVLFKLKTLNNFKKFLYSDKSNKFIIFLFIIMMILSMVIDYTVRFFFNTKVLSFLYPLTSTIYWVIFYYKTKISYIEKTL